MSLTPPSRAARHRIGSRSPTRRTLAQAARYLGALSLLAVGLDHLEQFSVDSYSTVPTIGTLFALNFAGAAVVSLGLAAPLTKRRPRWGHLALRLLAASGVAIALGSLAGLLISENGGLFGFVEHGYREVIVLAISFESATVLLLSAFLALDVVATPAGGGTRPHRMAA